MTSILRAPTAHVDSVRRTPFARYACLPGQPLVQRLAPAAEEDHLGAGLDQAVVALAAPVDDVHLARIRVPEDEEVVADQLELEHGLLGAHRLHRELLRLADRA